MKRSNIILSVAENIISPEGDSSFKLQGSLRCINTSTRRGAKKVNFGVTYDIKISDDGGDAWTRNYALCGNFPRGNARPRLQARALRDRYHAPSALHGFSL